MANLVNRNVYKVYGATSCRIANFPTLRRIKLNVSGQRLGVHVFRKVSLSKRASDAIDLRERDVDGVLCSGLGGRRESNVCHAGPSRQRFFDRSSGLSLGQVACLPRYVVSQSRRTKTGSIPPHAGGQHLSAFQRLKAE